MVGEKSCWGYTWAKWLRLRWGCFINNIIGAIRNYLNNWTAASSIQNFLTRIINERWMGAWTKCNSHDTAGTMERLVWESRRDNLWELRRAVYTINSGNFFSARHPGIQSSYNWLELAIPRSFIWVFHIFASFACPLDNVLTGFYSSPGIVNILGLPCSDKYVELAIRHIGAGRIALNESSFPLAPLCQTFQMGYITPAGSLLLESAGFSISMSTAAIGSRHNIARLS